MAGQVVIIVWGTDAGIIIKPADTMVARVSVAPPLNSDFNTLPATAAYHDPCYTYGMYGCNYLFEVTSVLLSACVSYCLPGCLHTSACFCVYNICLRANINGRVCVCFCLSFCQSVYLSACLSLCLQAYCVCYGCLQRRNS